MQKLIANTQTATVQKMRNPSIKSISFISVVSFLKTSLINVDVEFIAHTTTFYNTILLTNT